jgi:hypothetical protein
MPKKKIKYWDKPQEQLLLEYQKLHDNEVLRNQIYMKLRPPILKMIESVLCTFFGKNFEHSKYQYWINEAEYKVLTDVLLKYDPLKGTNSYAYVGTAIRHFFSDRLLRNTTRETFNNKMYSLYDDENMLKHDVMEDDPVNDDYLEYLQEIKNSLSKDSTYRFVMNTFIEVITLLPPSLYSRRYVTYLMLKHTGYSLKRLTWEMDKLKLGGVINRHLQLKDYIILQETKNIFEELEFAKYLQKTGHETKGNKKKKHKEEVAD